MNKYWSIDNYLLFEENVTCTTEIEEILSLGILEQNNNADPNHTIPKNTILKLPLWVALTLQGAEAGKINEPVYLGQKFYSQLSTDSTIINFKAKNQYFYDISLVLIPSLFDVVYEWTSLIWKSMVERFLYLYKNSKSVLYENYGLQKLLCYREKEFFARMVELNENLTTYLKEYKKINKEKDLINKRVIGNKKHKST